MYVPEHFQENDQSRLLEHIETLGFGILVLADSQGIEANHLPFLLDRPPSGGPVRLACHVARNNPVWQRLAPEMKVLVVFQGPQAYISPSWYPTKAEHGRAVPTWNYLAIHAEGPARATTDPSWLRHHLSQLTDHHERHRSTPWQLSDAPEAFTNRLMQNIVGIEITIDTLVGKTKASQNQPEKNHAGVMAGLNQEPCSNAHEMARVMADEN
ncbi:FMN-binding negative transcriptional regulator [Marinobacter xestospongiae]|uniref:FMN-binding negative transcriptional regulator n=1 Tax=Marinobacter xestospongiae TaxID=994319 RepID=UPI002004888A|nr:FMN-binding negative transcriptional regulator [Marinobacter xestospongiae]MCK7567916.1 FMN-binding negative transcriptional regulator [Marinobacter xestospongiae]